MEKKLAIAGKVIVFSDLDKMPIESFKHQLLENNATVSDDTAERLYHNLRGELTEEQIAAKEEAEARVAELRAQAEARIKEVKAAAEQKLNLLKKGK